MAGLKGGAHDVDVARAVKGVVAATVGHLDQLLDNGLALEVVGVHKVGRAKLLGPLLLGRVNVDDDDLARLVDDGTLDHGQADAAGTEDGNVGALLDLGGHAGGTVARGDAAAEQAGAVHRGIGLDGDDRDVGDDGVLGKGRRAHKVEEVLALALEARGAVGHDALALGGTDLAAEVRLARLAKLALLALGGAGSVSRFVLTRGGLPRWGNGLECDDMGTGLHVGDALAHRLDDAGALVPQDDGERALGVLAGERVRVCVLSALSSPAAARRRGAYRPLSRALSSSRRAHSPVWHTPV